MSKKDSTSWRGWGLYRMERERLKDFRDQKREAREDQEVSERQYLVTINDPTGWDEEDHEYLMERLDYVLHSMLFRESYSIEEIKK